MKWLFGLIFLGGCATNPAVNPKLFEACPIAEPRMRTVEEATRIANARKNALIKCNKDKEEIQKTLGQ